MNRPVVKGYKHISEIGDMAIKKIIRFRNGEERPLITSLQKLNTKIGGFLFGEQWTIVAPSGTGKTGFVIWLIEQLIDTILNPVYKGKVLVLFNTFEMPAVSIYLRSLSKGTGLITHDLLSYNQRITDEQLELIYALKTRFDDLPIYYRQSPFSVRDLVENTKQVQGSNSDYYLINVIDHTLLLTKKNEATILDMQGSLANEMMLVKNDIQSLNILLSQVNGNIETSVDRDKIGQHLLQKTDIFGSSQIYNASDGILTLQRPGMYGLKTFGKDKIDTGLTSLSKGDDDLMVINTLKHREGNIGPIAIRHNIKNYQFFDERPNGTPSSGKTKIGGLDLSELNDD